MLTELSLSVQGLTWLHSSTLRMWTMMAQGPLAMKSSWRWWRTKSWIAILRSLGKEGPFVCTWSRTCLCFLLPGWDPESLPPLWRRCPSAPSLVSRCEVENPMRFKKNDLKNEGMEWSSIYHNLSKSVGGGAIWWAICLGCWLLCC